MNVLSGEEEGEDEDSLYSSSSSQREGESKIRRRKRRNLRRIKRFFRRVYRHVKSKYRRAHQKFRSELSKEFFGKRLLNIMRGDRLIQVMLVAYTETFPDPSTFPRTVLMSPLQLYKFCTFHTLLKTQVTPYLLDPAKGRSLVMQLKAVQVPSERHKKALQRLNEKLDSMKRPSTGLERENSFRTLRQVAGYIRLLAELTLTKRDIPENTSRSFYRYAHLKLRPANEAKTDFDYITTLQMEVIDLESLYAIHSAFSDVESLKKLEEEFSKEKTRNDERLVKNGPLHKNLTAERHRLYSSHHDWGVTKRDALEEDEEGLDDRDPRPRHLSTTHAEKNLTRSPNSPLTITLECKGYVPKTFASQTAASQAEETDQEKKSSFESLKGGLRSEEAQGVSTPHRKPSLPGEFRDFLLRKLGALTSDKIIWSEKLPKSSSPSPPVSFFSLTEKHAWMDGLSQDKEEAGEGGEGEAKDRNGPKITTKKEKEMPRVRDRGEEEVLHGFSKDRNDLSRDKNEDPDASTAASSSSLYPSERSEDETSVDGRGRRSITLPSLRSRLDLFRRDSWLHRNKIFYLPPKKDGDDEGGKKTTKRRVSIFAGGGSRRRRMKEREDAEEEKKKNKKGHDNGDEEKSLQWKMLMEMPLMTGLEVLGLHTEFKDDRMHSHHPNLMNLPQAVTCHLAQPFSEFVLPVNLPEWMKFRKDRYLDVADLREEQEQTEFELQSVLPTSSSSTTSAASSPPPVVSPAASKEETKGLLSPPGERSGRSSSFQRREEEENLKDSVGPSIQQTVVPLSPPASSSSDEENLLSSLQNEALSQQEEKRQRKEEEKKKKEEEKDMIFPAGEGQPLNSSSSSPDRLITHKRQQKLSQHDTIEEEEDQRVEEKEGEEEEETRSSLAETGSYDKVKKEKEIPMLEEESDEKRELLLTDSVHIPPLSVGDSLLHRSNKSHGSKETSPTLGAKDNRQRDGREEKAENEERISSSRSSLDSANSTELKEDLKETSEKEMKSPSQGEHLLLSNSPGVHTPDPSSVSTSLLPGSFLPLPSLSQESVIPYALGYGILPIFLDTFDLFYSLAAPSKRRTRELIKDVKFLLSNLYVERQGQQQEEEKASEEKDQEKGSSPAPRVDKSEKERNWREKNKKKKMMMKEKIRQETRGSIKKKKKKDLFLEDFERIVRDAIDKATSGGIRQERTGRGRGEEEERRRRRRQLDKKDERRKGRSHDDFDDDGSSFQLDDRRGSEVNNPFLFSLFRELLLAAISMRREVKKQKISQVASWMCMNSARDVCRRSITTKTMEIPNKQKKKNYLISRQEEEEGEKNRGMRSSTTTSSSQLSRLLATMSQIKVHGDTSDKPVETGAPSEGSSTSADDLSSSKESKGKEDEHGERRTKGNRREKEKKEEEEKGELQKCMEELKARCSDDEWLEFQELLYAEQLTIQRASFIHALHSAHPKDLRLILDTVDQALFDRVYETLEKTWWTSLSPSSSDRRRPAAYQIVRQLSERKRKKTRHVRIRKSESPSMNILQDPGTSIDPGKKQQTSPRVFWLTLSQSFARRWAYAKKRYHFALEVLSHVHPHYSIPFVRDAFELFFFKITRGDFATPQMVQGYLRAIRWKYAREASEQRDQTLVSRGLFMKNFLLEKTDKDQGETFSRVKPLDDCNDSGMEVALKFKSPAG
ncbi:transmembrane protein, partial [Cystoisospora suis]